MAISVTISLTILLMIFPATASFVSTNQYHTVYAASSSSSSSKGGSTNNSTSPIGSSTFLKVITKVDNTKGGTNKPSDFAITVSGNSPSPKSFSGSSSGTSVTLKAGKYKVTGSGPSGYNIAYSSGCSGTVSGGVPIKCTVSPSFSTSNALSGGNGTSTMHLIIIDKATCNTLFPNCPALGNTVITIYDQGKQIDSFTATKNRNDVTGIAVGDTYKIVAGVVHDTIYSKHRIPGDGYEPFWKYQETQFIRPSNSGQLCGINQCTGTMPPAIQIEVDAYYECVRPGLDKC
jgi:hypothetical protein